MSTTPKTSDLQRRTVFYAVLISSVLRAQQFPDLNNQVAEIRVTEMAQAGDKLKVTVQNVSPRTIRGLSLVLGRHRVDQDWSSLAGGGLAPNASASLTISTAGLRAGGTRHHPAPPGTLEVLDAVFTDGGPVAPEATKRRAAEVASAPVGGKVDGPKSSDKTPTTEARTLRRTEPLAPPAPAAGPTAELPSAQIVKKPDAPVVAPAPPTNPAAATPSAEPPLVAPSVRPAAAEAAVERPSAEVAKKMDTPILIAPPAKPATTTAKPPQVAPTVSQPEASAAAAPAAELPSAQVARKPDSRTLIAPPAKPATTTGATKPPQVAPTVSQSETSAAVAPTAELPSDQVARKPDSPILVAPPVKPPPGTPATQATQRAESTPAIVPPPPAAVRAQTPSEIRPAETNDAPKEEAQKPDAPPRPAGLPGTHEQGSKDELARLISLVEVYEPDLASGFPRQALRKMVAAVVKEQNVLAAQSAVTPFDQGQRSALQTFAYGIQLIQDRRDLDDDTLRGQVARFLRNQRQALAKR